MLSQRALCSSLTFFTALAASSAVNQTAKSAKTSSGTETYTDNAICKQNRCVNPLMPGLYDLTSLSQLSWTCSTHPIVISSLDFCARAVYYDPAVPVIEGMTTTDVVKQQDDAAATQFFYHLSALGYEAWEHNDPATDWGNDCVQSVWRMVCYTYFPKKQAGCAPGLRTTYQRPCSGCCYDYLTKCGVECCDESSSQCVFSWETSSDDGTSLVQQAYDSEEGPSALCTGMAWTNAARGASGASWALILGLLGMHAVLGGQPGGGASAPAAHEPRPSAPLRARARAAAGFWMRHFLFPLLLATCAISLHGCDLVISTHDLANWLKKETYLSKWGYEQSGSTVTMLNSCNDDSVTTVCSGHGSCTTFSSKSSTSKFTASTLSFCKCDTDYADPECSTRRKSQWKLFLLALFGGPFGADQFYLGYPIWATAKILTLGGFGFWWVYDVVRAGSGAVYARDFRVAADLPRVVYLLGILSLVGAVSFFWSLESYVYSVRMKRAAMLKTKESEEAKHNARAEHIEGPRFRLYDETADFSAPPTTAAYGSMPAPALPRAGAPLARPRP